MQCGFSNPQSLYYYGSTYNKHFSKKSQIYLFALLPSVAPSVPTAQINSCFNSAFKLKRFRKKKNIKTL